MPNNHLPVPEPGKVFIRLTVREPGPKNRYGWRSWCDCSCGNEKLILNRDLLSGKAQSCGCLHKERTRVALNKTKSAIASTNGGHNPRWRGYSHPRLYVDFGFAYRDQAYLCEWPRCFDREQAFGRHEPQADHDHTRCSHANNRICPACFRGWVHSRCNKDIIFWDRVISEGLKPVPDDVLAYIHGKGKILNLRGSICYTEVRINNLLLRAPVVP